jgi:hypothetical protein
MPNYDFKQLSSFDFEMLIHSLLEKEWGTQLEVFKSGRDQGIDLRYACPRTKSRTIIQCKHYASSSLSTLLSHLRKDESVKVKTLSPDRYVIVTSLGLNPQNKDEISEIFKPFIKAKADIIGQTQINQLLEKHSEVEQKNFKLWLTSKAVLDRVLHNAEISRTEFAVDSIIKKLPIYVQNDAYPRAMEILQRDRAVIISGEPGIGKTTLANMILYAHLSDGYKPVVIRSDLKEGLSLYNKEEKQVFYFDDFLGQTFLREQHGFLLRNEDASLIAFVEMIQASPNAKLILTTREHIFSNAMLGSERLRRSPLIEHKCVLRLTDYDRSARARILYNHIYFSELPEEYRRVLINDSFYERILAHPNFNPRLIEWLSSYRRIKQTSPDEYSSFVSEILENPHEIWHEAFQNQISNYARSVLLVLFSFGGSVGVNALRTPWKELSDFEARKYNYPLSREGYEYALREVEGSFVSITQQRGKIEFLNPSVKDFVSGEIARHPERLDDLIQTSQRFSQLVTLWRWSQQSNASGISTIISGTSENFTTAVEAALARPYCRIIDLGNGSAEQQLDMYPEERLASLIAMVDSLRSVRLLASIPLTADAVLERWKTTAPDFGETSSMLSRMEDESWSSARLDPSIYTNIRKRMFAELKHATSLIDFEHVHIFSMESNMSEADDEAASFSEGINNYMRDWFQQDLSDVRNDSDRLHGMSEFLTTLNGDLGYGFIDQYESVMEVISEREEYEERHADEAYDRWKDSRGFERADDEAISRMFDSLK